MSNKLEPIAKLNAREPKMSGAGMPDRNKETYSKMPGMGCHGSIPVSYTHLTLPTIYSV